MKTYNPDYKRRYPELSFAALRSKLIAAVAMLVVAATLLATASYAWFVMSTAPEAAGIETQVGANGALEIALLDSDSWDDLTLLDMGDFDESAATTTASANLTWGNLINLGDESYGLGNVILQPSRLSISQNGTDSDNNPTYKVGSTFLKTPVYGSDGRISKLDSGAAVACIYSGSSFSETGYGVRAIGTSSTMNAFQLGMTNARSQLVADMAAAKTQASTTLGSYGSGLANIVVQYGVSGKADGYTVSDVQAVKDLAEGLKASLDELDAALRQAFYGYLTTASANISEDNLATAAAEVQNTSNSLSTLLTKYAGISSMIPNIATYVSTLSTDTSKVNQCIENCDAYIDGGGTFTWAQVSGLITPLCDTDKMTVSGKTITELKSSLKNEDNSINYEAALALVSGGITISVPTGSGVLSDIADYAGNYTAKVSISSVTVSGQSIPSMTVNMSTATTVNPVYLTVCNNNMKKATIQSATGSSAITDFYGYAIDMAFRTNAKDSNLLLQTESENRVYSGDEQNAALQGGGSYMQFTTSAGISCTKMVKLMKGIRIAFLDGDQNVLAIAALDCTLGKDVYTTLDADDERGNYAYLDGSSNAYQISDGITYATYEALPETSAVTFDKTANTVTAKLYLQTFEMTKSSTSTANETKYTGGLTINAKKSNSIITSLEQDTAQKVTAVVYMDGSYVTNAMVAADSTVSMAGTLNLQFASDATLIPAENTALKTGKTSTSN